MKKKPMTKPRFPLTGLVAGAAATAALCFLVPRAALAQVAPDAGQSMRDLERPVPQLAPARELELEFPAATDEDATTTTAAGGKTVEVAGFALSGQTRFSAEALLALLADLRGQSLTLAQLQEAASRITRHYRAAGYALARAYVPAQTVEAGVVRLVVLEGRYGEVAIEDGSGLRPFALAPLKALRVGDVVRADALERALLLVNERSGVRASAVLKPGQEVGTTNLAVQVAALPRWSGRVDYDNGGNRFTGAHRVSASVGANSPLRLGDRFDLQVLGSNEKQFYYRAGWQVPLGGWGTVAGVGYSYMDYQLGEDFKDLDAYGKSATAHVFVNQPLVASRKFWLAAKLEFEHKRLKDWIGLFDYQKDKRAQVWSLSLDGNARDDWLGGGITSFSVAWRHGRLALLTDDERQTDALGARTAGGFDVLAPSLVRLNRLSNDLSLFLRLRGQWTDGNVDGSEKLGLGGASGVRAYPQGEGQGDRGGIANVELRYALSAGWQVSAFYDHGYVQFNAKPWDESKNHRTLKGAGVGVAYADEHWRFDVAAAWKVGNEEPQSDTRKQTPRIWLQAGYAF
jgi:hemolysin activation/secretion protein